MDSQKNFPISPAANDLFGQGDALKNQLDAQEIERKKKLLAQAQQLSPASAQLFPQAPNM